jgi:CRP/FNR family transcriptional regulator, cyclic AMP receptor protein
MEQAAIARLEQNGWFAALPPDRCATILARLRVREAEDGTHLYRLGDPPNGLHVVIEGRVRMVSYPAPGTEMVSIVFKPGRWFGELSVLDGLPRPHDAIVVGPSRIGRLPMAEIEAIADAVPGWWRELALLTCAHQRLSLREAARSRSQPAIVRLAGLLARHGDRAERSVRITQDELARTIGISRQRVNRLLAELADAGLLNCAYGAIEVRDPAGLRRYGNEQR